MAENRQLKVFLCHSKEDKPKIRKLYHRLISDGFDAWLDEEKLIPGHNWDYEIRKAMRESDVVVVCLSNNAVTKTGYVQKEIRQALDKANEQPEGKIYLIPVKLEDCKVPDSISQYQWVDLFDKNGYKKLMGTLVFCADDRKLRYSSNELKVVNLDMVTISIPILGPITAGPFMLVPEPGVDYLNDKEYEAIEIARNLLPANEAGTDLYALQVIGDGMRDAMVNHDDIIIVKPATEAHNGDMAIIRVNDEYTLKYFFMEKNRYRLQPANPTMKPVYVDKNAALEINGKVVMVVRQMKKAMII